LRGGGGDGGANYFGVYGGGYGAVQASQYAWINPQRMGNGEVNTNYEEIHLIGLSFNYATLFLWTRSTIT
jgi:hypothetical protein